MNRSSLCLRATSVRTGNWGVKIDGRNMNIKMNLRQLPLFLPNSHFVCEDEGSTFFRNGGELLPLQEVLLFIVSVVRTSNLTLLYSHFCHNAEISRSLQLLKSSSYFSLQSQHRIFCIRLFVVSKSVIRRQT